MQMTARLLLVSLLSSLAACGGGGSTDTTFVVRTSSLSVAGTTPLTLGGRNLFFLASEATTGAGGTDFNGDGDQLDAIAVAVDTVANLETRLNVAALDGRWIGNELYLTVSEALDARDWSVPPDGDQTDTVLLHYSRATNVLTYIDQLASNSLPQTVSVGTQLFYTSSTLHTGPGMSNLYRIAAAAPTTTDMVDTSDAVAELKVDILAQDEGLIFLGLDEAENARSLNSDADSTDDAVLALLNGRIATGVIRNTEKALDDDSGPFRAKAVGTNDWQVGFLVSEAQQGSRCSASAIRTRTPTMRSCTTCALPTGTRTRSRTRCATQGWWARTASPSPTASSPRSARSPTRAVVTSIRMATLSTRWCAGRRSCLTRTPSCRSRWRPISGRCSTARAEPMAWRNSTAAS
jgi:hypothetical protein